MKKVIEEKNGAMLTREKVEDLSKKVDDLQNKKNIPSENNSSLWLYKWCVMMILIYPLISDLKKSVWAAL